MCFHTSIQNCLSLLAEVAETKLSVATRNNQKMLLNFLLASNIVEPPDRKDLLSMMRGPHVFCAFYIYFTKKKDSLYTTHTKKTSLNRTKKSFAQSH